MADKVTIWNMAISAAGANGSISSPTENSREAALCRLWWPLVSDAVLRAAPWPSVSAWAKLAVAEEADLAAQWAGGLVPPSWRFAYASPAGMLTPRHLHSFGRFVQFTYEGERFIAAQDEQAILHYSVRQDNIDLWDIGLQQAVVYYLAGAIATELSGKPSMRDNLLSLGFNFVLTARTDEANASDDRYEDVPSWVQARGYTAALGRTRYYFPYADVNLGA